MCATHTHQGGSTVRNRATTTPFWLLASMDLIETPDAPLHHSLNLCITQDVRPDAISGRPDCHLRRPAGPPQTTMIARRYLTGVHHTHPPSLYTFEFPFERGSFNGYTLASRKPLCMQTEGGDSLRCIQTSRSNKGTSFTDQFLLPL